jgi:hypothetical protein
MLRNFAAALLATVLIAGPALAAQPSSGAGSMPAAAATPQTANAQTHQAKPSKSVKRMHTQVRKHVARAKAGTVKLSRHFETRTIHRHHVAHIVKPGKISTTKSTMTANLPNTQSVNR